MGYAYLVAVRIATRQVVAYKLGVDEYELGGEIGAWLDTRQSNIMFRS